MVDRKVHSKWACKKCNFEYASPVTGTHAVSHYRSKHDYHTMTCVWRSEYDKMK